MIEQRPIAWQIAELTQSIARRKRRVAEAEDPRYAAIVRKSIECDEKHLLDLQAQLRAAAESGDTLTC